MLHHSYRYPAPRRDRGFRHAAASQTLRAELTPAQDKRIAGLGIAMPFELWNWADTVGAPRDVMDQWRASRHPRRDPARSATFPVYLQNDATSACGAELVFGQSGDLRDFVYFYIGAFAGGGIVLNGRLYGGPTGNAGALGSMPVPGPDGKPTQLIDVASIAMLEKALNARGSRGFASVDVAGGLGRRSAPSSTIGSPAPPRRSPTRSSPRPRSSISRRR